MKSSGLKAFMLDRLFLEDTNSEGVHPMIMLVVKQCGIAVSIGYSLLALLGKAQSYHIRQLCKKNEGRVVIVQAHC